MFFLNLTLAEFLTLAAAASGLLVALYLLDRSRRREKVATLRFWNVTEKISQMKHRRRIQQPWSLILQLASLLLLLAAIAQLRWGAPERHSRDHVVLLDTSAWMAAPGRSQTLMEEAKSAALAWVRSMPASDRAMVVRADAVALPATGFETDRRALEQAIRQTSAGAGALGLDNALRFARQAQRLSGRAAGEIVYAGPGRLPRQELAAAFPTERLRLLPVSEPPDNCGLRKISLRRSHDDPAAWEIFVAVRNYGRTRRGAPLAIEFGHAPIGSHRFTLAPGEEQSVTFRYRTRAGGWLDARLLIEDGLMGDNRALLEVPAQPTIKVQVYSDAPELLRPVLGANPNVEAAYARPTAYRPDSGARIVILDRFRPAALPDADTVWIEPPAGLRRSPPETWKGAQLGGAGTRKIRSARAANARPPPRQRPGLPPASGDLAIADCAAGPVILGGTRQAQDGRLRFHPAGSRCGRTGPPLVFGQHPHWMAPEAFRRWELNGGSVGTISTPVGAGTDPAAIRVLADGERELPFTVQNNLLRFFSPVPGTVRLIAADRETVFSLTLPDVAEARWEAPREIPRGIPRGGGAGPASRDLWQALALAGAAGLVAEWLLFGRGRRPGFRALAIAFPFRLPWRKAG
jgi:hypothetical protein